MIQPDSTDFLDAEDAAALLGVNVATLYAYVSRKGLRSIGSAGTRRRRYWRADIERLRGGEDSRAFPGGELLRESDITLITDGGLFYRGHSAVELSKSASLEDVASLMWGVDRDAAFSATAPRAPADFDAVAGLLAEQDEVDRAISLFPLLESANPRAHDPSTLGMSRAGSDVLRWLGAIFLRRTEATSLPLHLAFKAALGLSDLHADLVRRMLVLSADHGLTQATFIVRAVASTGVTPWRAVATGLAISMGRRSRFGHFDALRRFVQEIVAAPDPATLVFRRLREGEHLPGFVAAAEAAGDVRTRAMMQACAELFDREESFGRLRAAIAAIRDASGLEPTFSIPSGYGWWAVSPTLGPGPFLLGRAAGWIAHAIEQYQAGEPSRGELHYRGPLPKSR